MSGQGPPHGEDGSSGPDTLLKRLHRTHGKHFTPGATFMRKPARRGGTGSMNEQAQKEMTLKTSEGKPTSSTGDKKDSSRDSELQVTRSLQPLLGPTINPIETKIGSISKKAVTTSSSSSSSSFDGRPAMKRLESRFDGLGPLQRMQSIKNIISKSPKSSLQSNDASPTATYGQHGLLFPEDETAIKASDEKLGYPKVDMSKSSPFHFINKLIKNPSSTDFVYLKSHGPYDLKIAKHDHVDPTNYFTMSKRGVAHFYHGETEFISLQQWEREFFLFMEIKQIQFFKQFQVWKVFYFWNKFIRKQKNDKCRAFLKNNLYMLNKHLRPSLSELQLLCFNISRMSLFPIDYMQEQNGGEIEAMPLKMFKKRQEKMLQAVGKVLDGQMAKVRSIVTKACADDLKNFLIQNNFRKKEEKPSHAEHAAKRTKCRQLTKYIQLVDFFVMDTLISLCKERSNEVLESLAQQPAVNEDELIEFPLIVDDLHHDYKAKEWEKGDLCEVKSRSLKGRWFLGQVVSGIIREGKRKWVEVEYLANDFPRRKTVRTNDPNLRAPQAWYYRIEEGSEAVHREVLESPTMDAKSTGEIACSVTEKEGRDFEKVVERKHVGKQLFLKLEDGRGWIAASDVEYPEPEEEEEKDEEATIDPLEEKKEVKKPDPIFTLVLEQINPLRMAEELERIAAKEAKRKAEKEEEGEGEGEAEDLENVVQEDTKEEPESDITPLFSVEVVQDEETKELSFTPQVDDFQEAIREAMVGAIEVAMSFQRLITHPELMKYTKGSVPEERFEEEDTEIEQRDALLDERSIIDTQRQIEEALTSAFGKAKTYSQSLDEFNKIYEENRKTQVQSFYDADEETLDKLLSKYRDQIKVFNDINTLQNVGVIAVDSEALKEKYLPSPEEKLADMHELVPRIVRDKVHALIKYVQLSNTQISYTPKDVGEFVITRGHVKSVQDGHDKMMQRYHEIQELHVLMETHKIDIEDDDRDEMETLARMKEELSKTMLTVETKMDVYMKEFTEQLEGKLTKDLETDTEKMQEMLNDPKLGSIPETGIEDTIEALEHEQKKLVEIEQRAETYKKWQLEMDLDPDEFEHVCETRRDLDVKLTLWSKLKQWTDKEAKWLETAFENLSVRSVQSAASEFNKIVSKLGRRWMIDGKQTEVATTLKSAVKRMNNTLPIVTALGCEFLTREHEQEIAKLLNNAKWKEDMAKGELNLKKLIEINAMEHKDHIGAIAGRARQESVVANDLQTLTDDWKRIPLPVEPHKGQKDILVLGSLEEILTTLDDSMVKINQILGSRYVKPIRPQAEEMSRKLLKFQETIDEWIILMRQWMYLENIFQAQDIRRQLPMATKSFTQVDLYWKDMMKQASEAANALEAGTQKKLLENIVKNNKILDNVQKQLEEYLTTKRKKFPRFYFLSNDELLEILANAEDLSKVQANLKKCFEAVYRLEFKDAPGGINVMSFTSPKGENIKLHKPLTIRSNHGVEMWLTDLEKEVAVTLQKLMKEGVHSYKEGADERLEWIQESYGQIVMTISQIVWSASSEKAIQEGKLQAWLDTQKDQLLKLLVLVRGKLPKLQRRKIVTLVTTDVHARDVTMKLLKDGVDTTSTFLWQQQLRFYWDSDCIVKQANAVMEYGYEYMGMASRLVITPLTDRCWMTITGALHLKFGCAPAGPAGTGKTESTKDLAKAMGIYCVVFNCSDQITFKMMAKHFAGLAQAGAWTCLDEFNRIDIEVLSVIAQQLLQIRVALLEKKPGQSFKFQGDDIKLKGRFGVMITMNPGYAGRTELPDNLKVLFRPVAMMIPDYALIAEIMLYAEGFNEATILARKMTKLYKLSSEQLSQQRHYDFGLRAVKSVLVMAGEAKRSRPDLSEDVILIGAMKDANLPKYLDDDLPLFNAIVKDLFPRAVVPQKEYGQLENAIKAVLTGFQKELVPTFINKIIQLFETFNVRFGVMLVGPSGGGKSTIYKTLQKVMTDLRDQGIDDERFQKVFTHVLNPKCVTMGELYGEVHPITQEWRNGLASTIMREAIKDETEDKHWVTFDGPVDALWIENMNTVLDDNMTLCLSNGERIKLKTELRMLFEVQDLEVASPATVSRVGIVYCAPSQLGYLPYMHSWIHRYEEKDIYIETPKGVPVPAQETLVLPEAVIKHIKLLFINYMPAIIKFLRNECEEPIATADIQIVTSVCNIFETLITAQYVDPTLDEKKLNQMTDNVFVFAVIWSAGASVYSKSKVKFAQFIKDTFKNKAPNPDCFGAFVDMKDGASYKKWDSIVSPFKYDKEAPFFSMVVPTRDTVRYSWLLQHLIRGQKSTFFTGLTGVGKSVIVRDTLDGMQEEGVDSVILNFSGGTQSLQTQSTIESKLLKLGRTLLGAPANKKLVIFVDDINMPEVEEYGAQPPVELLRQFCDYKGFWDREVMNLWKNICRTVLVAAAAPPGGGRADMTPRFTRHFNMMCISPPDEDTMIKIFTSICGGFLNKGFKDPIPKLTAPIVRSTVSLYYALTSTMLPTPAKSHYTFNLRDVSKVFQGVLQAESFTYKQPEQVTRLWVHEVCRCFHDRLINQQDKRWFTEQVVKMLSSNFPGSYQHKELFEEKPLIFGNWVGGAGYTEFDFKKMGTLERVCTEKLEEYHEDSSNPRMELVFFNDAVEHLARVARIMQLPRGNALLVGLGGSGRQSMTRLAASIAEYTCYEIELTRGFDYSSFQDNVRQMMRIASVEEKSVAFLFTENQILEERFLEDVNNILNSGEVPNLWQADDLSGLIEDMMPILEARKLPQTKPQAWATFVELVQENLHIVLTMSPVGDSFRTRCRKFPSLINCTQIDWYNRWPEEALRSVANKFLAKVSLKSDEIRSALAEAAVHVHISMVETCERFYKNLRRRVYTTPKSYLDMIQMYMVLLGERRQDVSESRDRLLVGLDKLEETNKKVAELTQIMAKMKPQLAKAAKDTAELLKQVKKEKAAAAIIEKRVGAESKKVGAQQAKANELKEAADAELGKALPALKKAMKALDAITKSDIATAKGLKSPPEMVRVVMEAVSVLLKFPGKPSWDTSKKMMGQSNFLQQLLTYPKDTVNDKMCKKMEKYMKMEAFTPEAMMSISSACSGLCAWCRAMVLYSQVNKTVEPLRQKVAGLNAELKAANKALSGKMKELKAVQDKVADLDKKCSETMEQKQKLDDQQKQTQQRLNNAEKLTSLLGSEQVRWTEDSKTLGIKLDNLVGDVFLSAACISYYGPFTGVWRNECVKGWMERMRELKLPIGEDFSLQSSLGKPTDIRQWNIDGLPTDAVSIDSAVVVERAERYPLMIDPQSQANNWIKTMYKKDDMIITTFRNPKLLPTLETAVSNGRPMLIEDLDESVDASIDPVLLKQTREQVGGGRMLRLGDNEVNWDPGFKLFMTTKLPNPHYMPEICIKVTLLNFTVTQDGLEDQLLGFVVKAERSDVERQRQELVVSMANDQKEKKMLEVKILKMLSESDDNILDDVDLIETLEISKTTSEEINKRIEIANVTNEKIDTIREVYRPVATRGSLLYFVISDMGNVDPMYQYSLDYFSNLFMKCLDNAPKSKKVQQRVENLLSYLTMFVYNNICRGLFEVHKLMYSFLICCSIMRNARKIAFDEWNILLRGVPPKAKAEDGEEEEEVKNPFPDLITEKNFALLQGIEATIPEFKGIIGDMGEDSKSWTAYISSGNTHQEKLPGEWGTKLSNFQQLLLLKVVSTEKLVFAFSDFVVKEMGKEYVEVQNIKLADVYKDTDKTTPVIFVLSSGADPTGMLLRFAKDMKFSNKLEMRSLGQGQGPIAERLIKEARKKGTWVCLQNCHLAKSWMPGLEKVIHSLSEEEDSIHDNFRLWLTSMPCDYFPVPVLQKGIKLTNEPPKGLRANLLRSFANVVNPEKYENCTKKREWKKMLFGLCFFHATVQERCKFGPLGWNIMYGFNDSDLETSMQVLQMFLEEQKKIPFDALTYVAGQINYGGRVTDDWDRRCLMNILSKFYTPDILKDGYKFSDSGLYYSPTEGTYQETIDYLQNLPLQADPEIFGMHENANLSFQRRETDRILATVLSIQPNVGGGGDGGKTSDEVVAEAAKMMEDKVPKLLNRKSAHPIIFKKKKGVLDSLTTVLLQEMDRFNRLLKRVRFTLEEVQKAIRGEVVMSAELDRMFTSILNNQVPKLWEDIAYPSLKPLSSWNEDLYLRIEFLRGWLTKGPPSSYWVPGFFYPQGFLTGTLQNFARKYMVPIDSLNFSFKVLPQYNKDDIKEAPEDGVYVYGLFFDGARWDPEAKCVEDSKLGELYDTLPLIHFIPKENYKRNPSDYEAPCYKTSVRAGTLSTTGQSTNFVLAIDLPSTRKSRYWVLKGAAILCQLND